MQGCKVKVFQFIITNERGALHIMSADASGRLSWNNRSVRPLDVSYGTLCINITYWHTKANIIGSMFTFTGALFSPLSLSPGYSGYPGYPTYQQSYSCLAPYPSTTFSTMSPYQVEYIPVWLPTLPLHSPLCLHTR